MFWVAFKGYNNGKALSLGAIEQVEAESFGMHGYPTEQQAEANPNIVPFIAKAQVNSWVFNAQGSLTQHAAPHVPVVGPVIKAAGNAAGAITNVNEFLSRLTSANTWIRIGEFVLGALLLLAGALHLSGHSADIGDIGKLATKVVK